MIGPLIDGEHTMKVYMMRGVSCSGKSTIVGRFESTDVISSDEYRRRYLGSGDEQRFNKMIFDKMEDCLETRLVNMCAYTVIDSTNLRMKDGRRFRELVRQFRAELVIVDVEPPSQDELMRRNNVRFDATGTHIPEHVFEKQLKTYHDSLPYFEKFALDNDWVSMIKVGQDDEIKGVVGV